MTERDVQRPADVQLVPSIEAMRDVAIAAASVLTEWAAGNIEHKSPGGRTALRRLDDAVVRADDEANVPRRERAPLDFAQSEPDPDHSTLHCPCGATFTWSGFDARLKPWRDTHESHLAAQDATFDAAMARGERERNQKDGQASEEKRAALRNEPAREAVPAVEGSAPVRAEAGDGADDVHLVPARDAARDAAPRAVEAGPKACAARPAHLAALIELTKCICAPDCQEECCPQHGRYATLQEAFDAGREHERAMRDAEEYCPACGDTAIGFCPVMQREHTKAAHRTGAAK